MVAHGAASCGLVWDASVPSPAAACNRPVFDLDGRFVGTPDLLDPQPASTGCTTAALHLAGAMRHVDVAEEAATAASGSRASTMMAGDLPTGTLGRGCARRTRAPAAADGSPLDARARRRWLDTTHGRSAAGLSASDSARLLRYRRRLR